MTSRPFFIAAALLASAAAVPLAARAQTQSQDPVIDRQNPIPAPGVQIHRQATLPAEATPKPPVYSKVYAKPVAHYASGFDLSLRQVMVPMDAWAGLIRSSGASPERIAARIASIDPQTDLYWSGHVDSGASAILNVAVSHPLSLGASRSASLNSGQSVTLAPSLDRTGLVIVKISTDTTTLGQATPGTLPLQSDQRHSYPVSLHSGIATAIAQITPVDATHVDALILTATIDNTGK